MIGIIGWRRFGVIVLALLLIAGIDILNEGGLSFSARDAIIGTLGFYMGSSAVGKFAKTPDA